MQHLSLDYFRQKKEYPVSRQWIKTLYHFLINELCRFDGKYTLSVSLVDESTIKQLNRIYRGHDEVTDILSFEQSEKFIQVNGDSMVLGELVICVPYIQRQTQKIGRPWRFELQHLCIHGFLHLLGYHHETKKERRSMELLEERLLRHKFFAHTRYSTLHPHEWTV